MSASYKLVLRPAVADGSRPVHLRITNFSLHAYLALGIKVLDKHWHEGGTLLAADWVRKSHPDHKVLNPAIQGWARQAQQVLLDYPHLAAAALRDLVKGPPAEEQAPADFLAYFAAQIARRQQTGHPRTAEKFASILSKVRAYLAGPAAAAQPLAARRAQLEALTLPFAQLTPRWVRDYEQHLASLGNKESTINKELSFLNTILRQAVEDDQLAESQNPFKKLRLKHPKPTAKIKLSDQQVQLMEALELPVGRMRTLAREAWLLQYFLLGTRIGDALTLRWRNVLPDRVEFIEHKTGKPKVAPRHPRLDAVLTRLRGHHQAHHAGGAPAPDDFLLPYLRASDWFTQWPAGMAWEELKNSAKWRPAWILTLKRIEAGTAFFNRLLKNLEQPLGLTPHTLTTHTARHSFADAGRRAGVPMTDMRDLLNHHSIDQTEVYMGQLEKGEAALRALGIYTAK